MAATHFSGPVRSSGTETDGAIWVPAHKGMLLSSTAFSAVRVAAGDYCMRATFAGTVSGQAVFSISSDDIMKVGADPDTTLGSRLRGVQVNSVDVIYQITGAALTAHGRSFYTSVFSNNVANAISSTFGGSLSGALATATQTNPYVTRVTLGTPGVIGLNTALTNTTFEVTFTAQNATVLSYYGIMLNVTYNLM